MRSHFGVGRSSYAHWESESEHQPMPERYLKVLDGLGFSAWLRQRWSDGLVADAFTSAQAQAPGPRVKVNFRDATLGNPAIPVSHSMVEMRYAGEVPASEEWGDPLASETFVEMEAKFEHPQRFCARVRGMSCYPALKQGDMSVWHSNPSPPIGQIVLAQNDQHQCTVKELGWDEELGRPILKPVNEAEKAPPDGVGWRVVAQLVGVIRNERGVERTWYVRGGLTAEQLQS